MDEVKRGLKKVNSNQATSPEASLLPSELMNKPFKPVEGLAYFPTTVGTEQFEGISLPPICNCMLNGGSQKNVLARLSSSVLIACPWHNRHTGYAGGGSKKVEGGGRESSSSRMRSNCQSPPIPTAEYMVKKAIQSEEVTVEDLTLTQVKTHLTTSIVGALIKQYTHLIDEGRAEGEARVFVRRSTLYASAGKFKRAKKDAVHALIIDPSLSVAYYRLGCAEFGLGNPEAAAQAFSSGLKYNPGSQDLQFALQKTVDNCRLHHLLSHHRH
mmetsp:Transcript_41363/g.71215  ORF Transcript_41363/g.71215 Transcript_41363/m.71215 type:complete len:270 (+) Transcript_41363:147-956(+)